MPIYPLLTFVINRIKKRVTDKAVNILSAKPRHPSLNVHKARDVKAKYIEGGERVFIAYAGKGIRFTFEFGPDPGIISLRNCGFHDNCVIALFRSIKFINILTSRILP